MPAEQFLYNEAAPILAGQAEADAERAERAGELTDQTRQAYDNLGQTLQLAQPTITESGEITSPLLESQYDIAADVRAREEEAARQQADAQLESLNASIDTMRGNLQGALRQQADALSDTVGALRENLGTLDAAQRQALAEQIAAQQANLEQSITSQQTTLTTEIDALRGVATEAAQQRRAALEQQLTTLRAAQAPLNEARLAAAEGLVTAVNLGLGRTRDELTAKNALRGYVGGSTIEDAALARAVVDARQNAANITGQARLANQADLTGIERMGAGELYDIEGALAGRLEGLGERGATGRADLERELARGTRDVADFGAGERRGIATTTAGNLAEVGRFGAEQTYQQRLQGAADDLALANTAATGAYDIESAAAQEAADAARREAAARGTFAAEAFPTAINAGQIATVLPASQAAAEEALIPFATAGTRNAMNTLNLWSSPASPPGTTAVTVSPSTYGQDIAGLGANLVGSAFQIPRIWEPPKKKKEPQVEDPNV